jgi:hypothetical protein
MSQPYIETWNIVNRKFYTSKNKPVVFKFLLSNFNVFNNPYVYQGYLLQMKPGYYYFPDTAYYDVQIDLQGVIHYGYFHSTKVTPTTIEWSDGDVWTLSDVPRNVKAVNYLDQQLLDEQAKYNTETLYNRMNAVYGQHMVPRGQINPK